jgi:hypothetical protein
LTLWAAGVLAAHTSIESRDLVDQVQGRRAQGVIRRLVIVPLSARTDETPLLTMEALASGYV